MFSFISANWQGVPLESYATVVNLIAGTRTRGGLKVSARLDRKVYEKGQKIPEAEMERIPVQKHETHPWWHLQRLVDEVATPVTVCHYPPGTSKRNKSNIGSSRNSA